MRRHVRSDFSFGVIRIRDDGNTVLAQTLNGGRSFVLMMMILMMLMMIKMFMLMMINMVMINVAMMVIINVGMTVMMKMGWL